MRVILLIICMTIMAGCDATMGQKADHRVRLHPPGRKGDLSVEEVLYQRRSVREFGKGRLALTDVSQVLWAVQGVTHPDGYRTVPPAGALYPLEIYLVVGNVVDLTAGVYRYRPVEHDVVLVQAGDLRGRLAAAVFNQAWIRNAPAVLVISGVYERTAGKYGRRARRYVQIEVGCAAQNAYLQATASGLATAFVGAFYDSEVQEVLGLPSDHEPLGIMPLGRKRQ